MRCPFNNFSECKPECGIYTPEIEVDLPLGMMSEPGLAAFLDNILKQLAPVGVTKTEKGFKVSAHCGLRK